MSGRHPIQQMRGTTSEMVGFAGFRRQESSLILLNICVLSSLVVLHTFFQSLIGPPAPAMIGVFAAWVAVQIIEFLWLRSADPGTDAAALRLYSGISVWVNIAFAMTAALVPASPHTHYTVLMVLPTVAAAFRFGRTGITAVVGVSIFATFAEVRLHFRDKPDLQAMEYFEAATLMMIYIIVALVVSLLVRQLRAEERRLRESFDELERTRDRLITEEKLAAIGRLSSAIAHEIRNPVAMIASAAESARGSGHDPARQEQMREIVALEAARLEKLTNDFLGFARQQAPERKSTSIGTTLDYVAALIRPTADEKGIEVRVECPPGLEAKLDPFMIHQALLNLAMNAVDASGEGGHIGIGASSAADGGLALFVEDSGDAIPADVLARIFEPFFTTKPKGTGLGLALTRKIAEAHGGAVSVTANEPGKVRFTITLAPAEARRGGD